MILGGSRLSVHADHLDLSNETMNGSSDFACNGDMSVGEDAAILQVAGG